jgi:hypothetical protein
VVIFEDYSRNIFADIYLLFDGRKARMEMGRKVGKVIEYGHFLHILSKFHFGMTHVILYF